MRTKLSYLVCGLALLAAGCQSDDSTMGAAPEGEGNVQFRVSAPEALETTRAYAAGSSSARGGLTNVDFTEYDLRYQLAVYRVDGSGAEATYTMVVEPQMKVTDSYEEVNYSLNLAPGRTYRAVVWADFVRQGSTEDLHYDTQDFEHIHAPEMPDKYLLNDESKDAYTVSHSFSLAGNAVSADLVLERPFAKLRVVTADWGTNLDMPDNFRVYYYGCQRFTALNAVTGEAEGTTLGDSANPTYTAAIDPEDKEYATDYDASASNRTLIVDYLLADRTEETPIHFRLRALKGNESIVLHDLDTDIPIRRNWLTTVTGNVLTTGAQFNISIDEEFENQWTVGETWWNPETITLRQPAYDEATKTYHITDRNEFAWISENAATAITAGCTLSIENDIDMTGTNWKPIYKEGEPAYTVEGNGHTLRNFTIDARYAGTTTINVLGPVKVNAYIGVWGKFDGTMRDLTFENISINGLADSETHTADKDGNPVDHSDEDAWFAGCIGYTGANYTTPVTIENVHARHVHIEASGSNGLFNLSAQNVGGLIGWVGVGGGVDPDETTQIINCSAEDVHITGWQAGGLVGETKGGRGVGFTNCWTEDVEIRIAPFPLFDNAVSGFIGNVEEGNSVRMTNCRAAQNLRLLDLEGNVSNYQPANDLYGDCESGTPNIEASAQP